MGFCYQNGTGLHIRRRGIAPRYQS